MDNFVFYNPTKLIFGKNTIREIGKEIASNGIKKILLLAGSGSIKTNGVYDSAVASLKSAGIEWIEVWGVRANPTLSHALSAIQTVRDNNLEAVLALGGGSVIDESKSIAAGFYLDNLWSAFEKKVPVLKALPVFTVLTLSGTCSEMDSFAVLSNEEEKKKWNIGANCLYPKVSIIDPSVQMSLPWHQTVNGGIDAMSHIMEFYFMGNGDEVTLSLDEALMKTIIDSINALQKDPDDYNARANLAWTATLGLNGISGVALKGGDWGSHRIEHGISALHPEVAHGAGLAVVFPAWIKYVSNENPVLFSRWAKNIWNADSVDEALNNMKKQFFNWNAPISLRNLGIREDEIFDITENAIRIGSIGVLKNFNFDDIVNILKIAF